MATPGALPSFGGRIGRTVAESEPWFEQHPQAPTGAPNVVFVLLDDTGFAQLGCYGSDIDTPHIDALAANGIQFTNFHVAPLCSPTRASLLTGRSQHAVGMRSVSNFQTGYPNQLGHITNHAATIAEVLRDEGYATFCTGKWHLAPTDSGSAAGPFGQWPLGRGFDRFYGFLEGETDQFFPELVADNHPIDPPARPEDGYHVSEDLVDQMLRMINNSKGVRPDRPLFAYVPFGATHAPHQAPPEYLAKYRGLYDEGWDVVRQRWYDRQVELGVIPSHTVLAPLNPGVRPWDALSENEQKLACRLQEAFAAFLDHTDDQIGRLVAGLEHLGQLDNTILIVMADNGASQEGGPTGVMHEFSFFNQVAEPIEHVVERLDDIGGPNSHTNYPWGWAQCGNSPFRWYKQNTHEGGVHVPMVVHWPAGIAAEQRGTKRNQFVNVSDVTPTVYELLEVTAPDVHRGLGQLPVTGDSFASVLADPDAPATNTLQYFENSGSRALVACADGIWWKAVVRHRPGDDFDTEPWELFDLGADPSECNDLAADLPERLEELISLWWDEAERNGVLPLDDRQGISLFGARLRENSPHPPSRRYVYRPPLSRIPVAATPAAGGNLFDLTARVSRGVGDEGVIWATGSASAGVSVFVQNEHLVVDYSAFGNRTVVESSLKVPEGDCELSMRLRRTDKAGGVIELEVDGQQAGTADLPYMMRMISSVGSSVGHDYGSTVSERYEGSFPFSGTLHEVEINLSARTEADVAATARAEMARQ
ncbi:arylsulfatase [Candidatus Poriferisodalis sp.]|uniref:arylsulfatase n=1 Tax=Candidatus Poriferisodalis sp. TaxID=3101277 RepID=UPI003B01CB08